MGDATSGLVDPGPGLHVDRPAGPQVGDGDIDRPRQLEARIAQRDLGHSRHFQQGGRGATVQRRQHRVADEVVRERHDHDQVVAGQPALQPEEPGIGEGIQQVGHVGVPPDRRLAPTGRPPADSTT